MHRILLICVLLSTAGLSHGQKIRFSDSTNKWLVEIIPGDFPPFNYEFKYLPADTVLNGLAYRTISFNGMNLIREETNARKVYIKVYGSSIQDTTEQVIYDYTRTLGDTVISRGLTDTCFHVLDAIDSVVMNGVWHTTQHYEPVPGSFCVPYWVIEGVGSLVNPIFPICPQVFEPAYIFLCFTNRNSHPVISSPQWPGFNTTTCTAGVESIQLKSRIIVSPNPAKEQIRFSKHVNVKLLNCTGQLMAERQNVDALNVDSYPTGLYYLMFYDSKGAVVQWEKMVKE